MTTSKKSGGLLFPTDYIHENLVSGKYAPDVTEEAAVHMSAVLQYMAKELLEISGNIAKDNKSPIIMPRHLLLAVRNDDELNKLFPDVLNTVTKPSLASVLGNTKKSKQSPSSSSINKQMSNLSLQDSDSYAAADSIESNCRTSSTSDTLVSATARSFDPNGRTCSTAAKTPSIEQVIKMSTIPAVEYTFTRDILPHIIKAATNGQKSCKIELPRLNQDRDTVVSLLKQIFDQRYYASISNEETQTMYSCPVITIQWSDKVNF